MTILDKINNVLTEGNSHLRCKWAGKYQFCASSGRLEKEFDQYEGKDALKWAKEHVKR